MKKKSKNIILLLAVFLSMVAGFFLFSKINSRNVTFDSLGHEAGQNSKSENNDQDSTIKSHSLYISGWLPYWAKKSGIESLKDSAKLFNEINIFAYGVNSDGTLIDKAKISGEPWLSFIKNAQAQNLKIVPTILWGDAEAMHKIFTDQGLTQKHVAQIVDMLKKNNFSGVDIDYEGKDIADKDNFSNFLSALHANLSSQQKTLTCTVEARTQDDPPAGFTGIRAMSWANDYHSLNADCDSVRVMAYDQVFQTYRAKAFAISDVKPYAPNADINWVKAVVNYTLKYIPREKLNLGIPTYGWEFLINKTNDGFNYAQLKSISYPDALQEANIAGITPTRNVGGELDFSFKNANSNATHYVNFSDSVAVEQKIALAKEFGLEGVSLFKIDGLTDPKIFDVMKNFRF